MNSRNGNKSWRLLATGLLLVGCGSTSGRNNYYKTADDSQPLVDPKYKLSADRQKLAEFRAQVPPEKQGENDEVAYTLQLLSNTDRNPSDVRNQFDNALRKKREKFQKDLQKERDEFTKKERQDRESFLKQMASTRNDFLKSKHGKEERDQFFSDQEELRRSYFENQQEKRNDFESDVTERRRNFEDYAHEKSSEFFQEWRAYQHRYEDVQKEKQKEKERKEKERSERSEHPTAASVTAPAPLQPSRLDALDDFKDISAKPSTPLESGQ